MEEIGPFGLVERAHAGAVVGEGDRVQHAIELALAERNAERVDLVLVLDIRDEDLVALEQLGERVAARFGAHGKDHFGAGVE